ncbi:hypothetical protein BGZ70_000881 [Mortierella alpina]|uniref:Ion transport domain-containing protein n=1 Tax=Mortierella alpina TaxID=64518 RepID=A0A9P6IX15_MORAP|nr:hypothetical protein BGZ70_000881 [Mortierella alpina]
MSKLYDDHVIVDLSVASSGNRDGDNSINDKKKNGQTATSTSTEALRSCSNSKDKQEPAATALLSQQYQQQQELLPYSIVPEIITPEKGAVDAVKIHVEKGHQLKASLDLCFELVDRFKGANNTSSSYDIVETIDDSAPSPGMAFLFEMKPCDPKSEEQEHGQEQKQGGPSILVLPVTRRIDTPLTLVPPSIREDFQNVYILATAVSQDEKTVVTVSRKSHGVEFILDLWDLNGYYSYINKNEKEELVKSGRPVAWTTFTIDGAETVDISFLDVALSSNGELVAVFDKPRKLFEDGFSTGKFPLRVFQRRQATTATRAAAAEEEITAVKQQVSEKGTSAVGSSGGGGGKQAVPLIKGLEEVLYDKVSPLFTFAGFAKFQHRSKQDSSDNSQSTDPQEFILVACNGRCLEVYEARTGLKLLYTLSLAALSLNGGLYISYKLLMMTLQNSMFVWYTNADKDISVWNWRTGKNVGYFPKGCKPVLSTDESLLVVFRDSLVFTYSPKNGQLQGLRTNIAWNYRQNDDIRCWYDVLSQGNGRLAMLYDDDFQDFDPSDRDGRSVRYVDMHNVEDIQETIVAIPPKSWPIHVLPSTTLNQENIIGSAIVCTSKTVQILNLQPDKTTTTATATVCGPDCSKLWEFGPKRDSFYDEKQRCSFRFTRDRKNEIVRLDRIWGKRKSNARGVTLLKLPFRPRSQQDEDNSLSWTILQDRNQCYIFSDSDFELWQLPTTAINQCTLLGIGDAFDDNGDDYYGSYICTHGGYYRWNQEGIVSWFGTSNKELSGTESIAAIMKNIARYTDDFDTYPVTYRKALVKFIARHINKDPGPDEVNRAKAVVEGTNVDMTRTSFMWKIVLECVRSGKDTLLLGVLRLNNDIGYWMPSPDEFSVNAENDMIAYLIGELKLPVAEILIDYCLAKAHSTDPMLLEKLMISVPHLIPKHPDVALNISRRTAFLPVLNRDQLLQQAVYNGDQWRLSKFWVPAKTKLYEVIDQNPVFHRLNRLVILYSNRTQDLKKHPELLPVTAKTVKKNAGIKSRLYMAPFSLAWTIYGGEDNRAKMTKQWTPAKSTTITGRGILVLQLIWHFVFPFHKVFIRSNYDDLQAYDNPAFSALITYKWTRFARYFWCLRLLFQISYEVLVLVVTLYQLYGDEEQRSHLVGGYLAIIVLGYMLLHRESQQMRGGICQYFSSFYNYVDLCVYMIPTVSSGILIAISDQIVALRAMSFSVVLIYIQFIFELRVFRNVCQVVTIVVNILFHIPAFFIILAIFILSFAHSINHLIEINFRAVQCRPDSKDATPLSICNAQRVEFPRDYLQSISATYFFMTGNYSPVQTSLTNGHWTIQLMVSLFFFLTAVLMMNVVIALMNGVYTDTNLTVDQIWLKNRLDLITEAENLSLFLPYFRNHFDYFPKWVYYTATDEEVEEYQKKYATDKTKVNLEKDEGEVEEEVEEELEEDSENDDVDDDDDCQEEEEGEKMEQKKPSSDFTTITTTSGRNETDLTLPSAQDIVNTLRAELCEIKDRLAIHDELWQAERKKQQERLELQDREMKAERASQDERHRKVEEMLMQMLLTNQRSA